MDSTADDVTIETTLESIMSTGLQATELLTDTLVSTTLPPQTTITTVTVANPMISTQGRNFY